MVELCRQCTHVFKLREMCTWPHMLHSDTTLQWHDHTSAQRPTIAEIAYDCCAEDKLDL